MWRVSLAVCAIVLYAMSISGTVYEATTPHTLSFHVALRKVYAVLAFALLGFLVERARLPRMRGVLAAGVAIAVYSYAIELGQMFIDRSAETFAEHSFDVASGFVGGALGAFVALLFTERAARRRRVEAIAVVLALLLLVWGFAVTYGAVR